MLETIRSRSKSFVVMILSGLLILSFIAWGIGDFLRGSIAQKPVAEIGPIVIDQVQFNDVYQREIDNMRRFTNGEFDIRTAQKVGLKQIILQRFIQHSLFTLGARDLKVAASDRLVSAKIKSMQAFQNQQTRQFDSVQFQAILQNRGLREATFVDLVRDDLTREMYIDSLIVGTSMPRPVTSALVNFYKETRTAEIVKIPNSSIKTVPNASKDTLRAYHKKHAQKFTAPEYRKLTFIYLHAADLAHDLSVSEDQLLEVYQERQEEFSVPERRTLEQMLLKDEATAKIAAKRLADGESFAVVAKDLTGTKAADLSLGLLSKDDLLDEIAEVAFATEVNKPSIPVQSPLGWHILRTVTLKPYTKKSFKDVRKLLQQDVIAEMSLDALYKLSNKLDDALGGGATLEEAAQTLGLSLKTAAIIDNKGFDANEKPIADLPERDLFLRTAFNLPETDVSPLVEANTESYFVVRVDQIIPPVLRPFNDVKRKVVKAWKETYRTTATKKRAETLLKKAKTGTSMKAIAAKARAKVTNFGPFTRTTTKNKQKIPVQVIRALFAAQAKEHVLVTMEDAVYIARVKKIKKPSVKTQIKTANTLHVHLSKQLASDLVSQLAGALRKKYDIKINQDVLQQVL